MSRARFVALLCLLLPLPAFGQSVNWSTGVIYEYDGSGNVKRTGTDTYQHDTAQRLVRGSVAGSQQSHSYDSFGNRKACQSAGGGDCQYGFTVDSSTNRIEGRAYDKRGNMLQLPEGNTLEYDELGMVRQENGNGRKVYYIYTADDERIAVYEADTQLGTHNWQWTLRGLDRKPLREFTSEGSSGTTAFRWAKDHIWRDSVLLASRQADSGAPGGVSTYHYHVDHLGTPRQVTNSASVIIGRHDYLPFGPELPGNTTNEPKLQDLKFTGHERDEMRDRPPLDYMHARYYEPRLGRFLSVDPTWGSAELSKPQSWNRYSYVMNNPVSVTDPDGKCPSCILAPINFRLGLALPPEQAERALKMAALMAIIVITRGEAILAPSIDPSADNAPEQSPPTEAYDRRKYYGRTPTAKDRADLGADSDEVVNHEPALVKRYYEGDPATDEKPGYQMTPEERRKSASDRSRMNLQPVKESCQQGAECARYSKDKKKEHQLDPP